MRDTFLKFTKFIKAREKFFFWVLFSGMIIFRILLITGVPKRFVYGPHDDLFFARAAQSMLKGQWMGPYNHFTLIKGPFYAFFLVGSFLSGLPLYLNESLFFLGASVVFFFALKPIIKNKWWLFFCFAFIMFIPSSLATGMHLRVYREFVYFILTLYVTAFAIGLFLRVKQKPAKMAPWSIGLGLSMGAFMLTREEGIWIYPVLFAFFVLALIIIWREKGNKKIHRSIFILLPLILWYLPILLVSYLNYSHYGFWGVTEQLEPEFNRVLNSLARIETDDEWHPAIQISSSARQAAYEASPTLAKYQETIERYVISWGPADNSAMKLKPDWYINKYGIAGNEIGNAHFSWLVRDLVAHNGFYNDGRYPKYIYTQIADELELACQEGQLDCKAKKRLPAMVGAIDARHLPIIIRMFKENFSDMIKYDRVKIASLDINKSWGKWPRNNEDYWVFEQFAYNPIDTINTVADDDLPKIIEGVTDLRYRTIIYKEKAMNLILDFYQLIIFPSFLLASIAYFILVFRSIKAKEIFNLNGFLITATFLLGLFISRLMTLTIIDATTSMPGMAYIASIHIFPLLFTLIMLVWIAQNLKILKVWNQD